MHTVGTYQDPEVLTSSSVVQLSSPEQFERALAQNADRLLVLMCKARSCRPCKIFSRKYARVADKYPDAVFMEVFGDDTMELRGLMMQLKIKATPTFKMFRNGVQVGSVTGANENKLLAAVNSHTLPTETGYSLQLSEAAANSS